MNREDVIRIAKEVWGDDSGKPWHESALVHLEAFAMRVEAAEREACAKVCDETNNWPIAHAIRARGQG
jgi:hypothetical protein